MYAVSLGLQTAVAAYLIVGEPFLGKYKYEELVFKAPTDPGARSRFYRLIIWLEWVLVGLVVLALWLGHHPIEGALGLLAVQDKWLELAKPTGLGILVALTAVGLAVRFSRTVRESYARRLSALGPLLPVTGWERVQFTLVCLTAGLCEEVLFRGFLLFYIGHMLPSVPIWGAVAITAVIFGFAHWYQGWTGVLSTGILGGLLGALYIETGSLWLPIVLHAFVDLQTLVIAWAASAGQRREAA